MHRRLLIRDFFRGMPARMRLRACSEFVSLIILPLLVGLAVWQRFYPIAYSALALAAVTAALTWRHTGERLRAWWRDDGWLCEGFECGERIGWDGIVDAFRISGILGDLPRDPAAYVLCPEGHCTTVEWDLALEAMREELAAYADYAPVRGGTGGSHTKSFVERANALVTRADPGSYLYKSLADIRRDLEKYSCRRWASLDREQLYRTLALLEAHGQVVSNRSLLGLPDEVDEAALPLRMLPMQISLEEIDNFSEVRNVPPEAVAHLHVDGYFDCLEEFIKASLQEILHEPLRLKDSPAELDDLYTSNVRVKGRRYPAAFMLKGRGVRSTLLTIKLCGKKGTQLVKLFDSPAEIFIVQFTGNISEYVIKDVIGKTIAKRSQKQAASFCIINGQDTVCLLRAYNKL